MFTVLLASDLDKDPVYKAFIASPDAKKMPARFESSSYLEGDIVGVRGCRLIETERERNNPNTCDPNLVSRSMYVRSQFLHFLFLTFCGVFLLVSFCLSLSPLPSILF